MMWHFEYSIDLDEKNRVAYGKIYGVWKAETGNAYVEEMKKTVKPLIGKPWAKIIDLSNWKSAYPEVSDQIGGLNRWCRQNGLEWTVYIVNQQAQYAMIMKMMSSGNFSKVGRTFRTMLEGEKFLMEQGYDIRPQSKGIFK